MTIPWMKCSDRMPPDDEKIIVRSWLGHHIKSIGYVLRNEINTFGLSNYKWIPYDEATWQELNK